jgi:O-antigen/teichoic acid export membrane protein
LALVPSGLLQKNLELKTISIINTVSAFLSGIVAVSFAYYEYKVWALIIQQLMSAALALIGFAYFAKWFPSFSFSLSSIKKLWQYGSKLLLSGILDMTFTRLDVFIIGKLFPIQILGYYNRAQVLDNLVRSFSASTTTSVAFPLIAKMSDDLDKTQKFYVRCLNVIAFLSFLLLGVSFLTCFDIVIILFTEKWLTVGHYFRIMSVTGFVFPVSALMVNIISARGNSKAFLKLEIIKKCILFPTYFSFFFGGVYLFLVIFGVGFLLALIANAVFVEKEISVSLKQQLAIIFKYGAVAGLATAIVFGLTFYLENIYLHLVISSVLFSILYLVSSYKLKFSGFVEIFNRALNFYNDKRRANVSPAA